MLPGLWQAQGQNDESCQVRYFLGSCVDCAGLWEGDCCEQEGTLLRTQRLCMVTKRLAGALHHTIAHLRMSCVCLADVLWRMPQGEAS